MKKPELSIIILNHNTKDLILNCLDSLRKVKDEVNFEIIVSDNESDDGSVDSIRKNFPEVKIIEGPNLSFSNGNNRAKKTSEGEYILFLNSDTLVHKSTLKKCLEYIRGDNSIGALTCKLILANGELDKDVRRRFPTPLISFKRLFLKNGGDYWYEDISPDKTHDVESIEGAFFLTRKKILDEVGWFDENYNFDGEDLDLCFQIKSRGYKVIYYPEVSITHLKKATKDKFTGHSRRMQGVDSMEYFYKKNMWEKYPLLISYLVLIGIKSLKLIRLLKIRI